MTVRWKSATVGGFRIVEGSLETGDSIKFDVPLPILRSEKRNYSIYVTGRWLIEQENERRPYGPGTYANEDHDGYLMPPFVTVSCTEGPGRYYCIEPEDRKRKWARTALRDLPAAFGLPKGSLLFLADGGITAEGQPFVGPAIINATVRDTVRITKTTADPVGVVARLLK